MKAILQRVSRAQVRVDGAVVDSIGAGYVALVGVARGDGPADVDYICRKIIGLRLWCDAAGKMNLPLGERAVLVISQFTLFGDTRRGMRPSFDQAAEPASARALYESLLQQLRALGIATAAGIFQADMEVELCNQGPVTVQLDSRG